MKTKMLKGVVYTFFACLAVFYTVDAGQAPGANTAASIGQHTISAQEFREALIRLRSTGDMKIVLKTFTPEGKEQILGELIDQKLLAQEAITRDLDEDPKIKQAIQNAIDAVLAEALRQREISGLDVSDSGLKKYYDANQVLFMTHPRVKARHIVTRTKEEAEAALSQIRNGEDFSQVASERNIESSKTKGGDLGWVVKGIMVKPFDDALFSLKEGQVSDIVMTNFGYHIVKAETIDRGKLKSFESIKEEVKMQMINRHLSQLREELEKKYPVQVNRELLHEIK